MNARISRRSKAFKFGVSFRFIDNEQTLDSIEMLKDTKVKAVELWEPTFEKDEAFIKKARKAFEKSGVDPWSIHAKFGGDIDISSQDPDVIPAAMESALRAIDLASRIGAKYVVLHPSAEPISDTDRPLRIRTSRKNIANLALAAREKKCKIAVEMLPRSCLGHSLPEILDLLRDADPDTAGVCLDTNHLMSDFASLPAIVRKLGVRLFTLHCSDYDGVDEKHWLPTEGIIDWSGFLTSLADISSKSPIMYEARLEGESPAERLACLETNFTKLMKLAPA